MSGGHPHPSRPGEPLRGASRVRHTPSGREGRFIQAGPTADQVRVLLDGATAPTTVLLRNIRFLDATEPASNPGEKP